MIPRSVNFYVMATFLTGMAMLTLIGLSMTYRINQVERAFEQNHIEAANNELQHAIGAVLGKVQDVAATIATWDETNQQLSDSTYYTFWRQRRIHAVQFIPIYVVDIELYSADGIRLQDNRESSLPDKVPATKTYLSVEHNYAWLYLFKPVMLHETSTRVFGYVGMRVDFLAALLEVNVFSHIDVGSIMFDSANAEFIIPDKIFDHMKMMELHKGEMDQLKQVTYETFAYIVALVLVVSFIIYWMVFMLFARPLTQLNRYLNELETKSMDAKPQENQLSFTVDEFNHFAHSLTNFQSRLYASQQSLHKMNLNLEQRVESRTVELQSINRELEAFSYSVSHDLRAPLRRIDGFCQALLEDNAEQLDAQGKDYLKRVISNTHQMANLIDDLLNLSRIARMEMNVTRINMSEQVENIVYQLRELNPERSVAVRVQEGIYAYGDEHLVNILLNNVVGNAWKYTGKTLHASVEFGVVQLNDETVYYVRDNGAGFDMEYVGKIFEVFQRLHGNDFEGTGIGLATAYRIVKRHNGNIWAESKPNQGACFYFTLHPVMSDAV